MSGEFLTLWSIRGALVGYFFGLGVLLGGKKRADWTASARWIWSAGCLLYLVHVAAAFHYFHGWSHASAVQETARQSMAAVGVEAGYGIYMNYLFTILWLVDVSWWWTRRPIHYFKRSKAMTFLIHGYLLFMVVNGTVVFEDGAIRWLSVIALLCLLVLWLRTRVQPEIRMAGTTQLDV